MRKPIPPLLMIPSTSGTGADVSQFCIITDTGRSVKVTIMSRGESAFDARSASAMGAL